MPAISCCSIWMTADPFALSSISLVAKARGRPSRWPDSRCGRGPDRAERSRRPADLYNGGEGHMKKTLWIWVVIAVTAPLSVPAQDASSVIDASTKAMGAAMLQSIRYTGTGTNNSVGQAFTSGGPWPRYRVTKYAALVNYSVPAMRQEIIRIDNEFPPRGGGAGGFNRATGQGGIRPVPGDIIQNQNIDGRTEVGALNIWLTPHGFLKGAAANGGAKVSGDDGEDDDR